GFRIRAPAHHRGRRRHGARPPIARASALFRALPSKSVHHGRAPSRVREVGAQSHRLASLVDYAPPRKRPTGIRRLGFSAERSKVMAKVFVFDIGPVKMAEAALHVLVASPGSLDIPIVRANTLPEAFAKMAPACAGYELACAPELEAEGRKFGFIAQAWTPEDAMLAAATAFHLAMSTLIGPLRIPRLIDEYLKAVAELWKAPMRQGWSPRDLIWFGSRGTVLGTHVLTYGDAIIVPAPATQ